ncbi:MULTISPECIES: cox cluster protein [unclassified Haladaptatus]|uniref:DUF7541 family protein n=1 Tax=unclassified Haladaptatus TaxID=2622732 RepID=UPI0023E81181|nr:MULTISPECIES: cox cluster protein [unclassified Haladaptatus]
MDEQAGLSDQYSRASPWPVFVALGLAISEVGIVMALFPLAVGGLLLFAGSVTGILQESDHIETPWPLLSGIGVFLLVVGAGLVLSQTAGLSLDAVVAALEAMNGLVFRGLSILLSGAILAIGGVVGAVAEPARL